MHGTTNIKCRKVFANKIRRFQACIDARGHHFQTPDTLSA